MWTFLASLVLGISLAATCGLRAFLPLFLVGVAGRAGFIDVGDSFAWLTHTPALLALGVAVVVELLADKVPFINHVLDVIAAPVRAFAGMLVCAAVVVDLPFWVVAILAIIVGGGVAIAVHVAKSGVRATSTAATAGAASPFHSLFEDAACAVLVLLSLVFFGVALLVAVGACALLYISIRALLDHFRRKRAR